VRVIEENTTVKAIIETSSLISEPPTLDSCGTTPLDKTSIKKSMNNDIDSQSSTYDSATSNSQQLPSIGLHNFEIQIVTSSLTKFEELRRMLGKDMRVTIHRMAYIPKYATQDVAEQVCSTIQYIKSKHVRGDIS